MGKWRLDGERLALWFVGWEGFVMMLGPLLFLLGGEEGLCLCLWLKLIYGEISDLSSASRIRTRSGSMLSLLIFRVRLSAMMIAIEDNHRSPIYRPSV